MVFSTVSVKVKGDFKKTTKFLNNCKSIRVKNLERLAQEGVMALAAKTPVDSGIIQASWGYTIKDDKDGISITWTNDRLTDRGVPIVILLHYGHATRNGGYVKGTEFINEALEPIFKKIADEVWEEVTK